MVLKGKGKSKNGLEEKRWEKHEWNVRNYSLILRLGDLVQISKKGTSATQYSPWTTAFQTNKHHTTASNHYLLAQPLLGPSIMG